MNHDDEDEFGLIRGVGWALLFTGLTLVGAWLLAVYVLIPLIDFAKGVTP